MFVSVYHVQSTLCDFVFIYFFFCHDFALLGRFQELHKISLIIGQNRQPWVAWCDKLTDGGLIALWCRMFSGTVLQCDCGYDGHLMKYQLEHNNAAMRMLSVTSLLSIHIFYFFQNIANIDTSLFGLLRYSFTFAGLVTKECPINPVSHLLICIS